MRLNRELTDPLKDPDRLVAVARLAGPSLAAAELVVVDTLDLEGAQQMNPQPAHGAPG
ncbi:MAG: hypothetical protein ACRD29_00990 [Acidimicrobiales bacterium]